MCVQIFIESCAAVQSFVPKIAKILKKLETTSPGDPPYQITMISGY